jgi:phage replication O-like protein O
MTKKKKVNKHFTPLFNEVLEGMAYAKLSPNEWQFIMVLWRLTYGRKNMSHKESGKYTTWVNAEFHRRTGLARPHVSRIKAGLLKKKVIIQKKGMIGFNKHFKKWDKGSYLGVTSIGNTSTGNITSPGNTRTGNRVLPAQVTNVTSTGNTNAPKVKSSAEVERLKKERKKETISGEKEFNIFWEKYPRKRQKQPARKAFLKYYEAGKFSIEKILAHLDEYVKVEWADRELKYIPHAASWLNKEPWEDVLATKLPRKEVIRKQWLIWQGGGITEEEFKRRRQHIINTYKESE